MALVIQAQVLVVNMISIQMSRAMTLRFPAHYFCMRVCKEHAEIVGKDPEDGTQFAASQVPGEHPYVAAAEDRQAAQMYFRASLTNLSIQ